MSRSERTDSKHKSTARPRTYRVRRFGWTALGAACILLIATALGWQWLHRARPGTFSSPPAPVGAPAPVAAETAGSRAVLYLAQMEQGERASARGDFHRAVKCYQRALLYTDSKADAQRALLTALIGVSVRESPEAANQLAAELLRERPDDPALLMTFSDTALLLDNVYGEGGMEGALKRLERVLQSQSEDPSLGKYILTSAWLDAGRADLARAEIERAVEATPDHQGLRLMACQLALALEDWNACLKHAEQLQRLDPDLADARWYQAAALERSGKVEQAKAIYQELVTKHPDMPQGYVGMSRILENAHDYGGAVHWIQMLLDRSPPQPGTVEILVRLMMRKGENQDVGRWAERMLSSPQSNPHAVHVEPGKASMPAGKSATEQAAQADSPPVPNRVLAVTLGAAAGFLDVEDYDQAESWAKRGQTAAKELPESDRRGGLIIAQTILGQIYSAMSHRAKGPTLQGAYADKAIDAYQALLEISPTDQAAANNLAIVLYERGETKAALSVAERLRRGSFSDKPVSGDRLPLEILDTLGTIYRGTGQFDQAAGLFQEAAKRYTKEPLVLLHLGRAYAGLRQYAAATVQLNLAATLAEEKAKVTADAAEKAKYQAMAEEARKAMKDLKDLPRRS